MKNRRTSRRFLAPADVPGILVACAGLPRSQYQGSRKAHARQSRPVIASAAATEPTSARDRPARPERWLDRSCIFPPYLLTSSHPRLAWDQSRRYSLPPLARSSSACLAPRLGSTPTVAAPPKPPANVGRSLGLDPAERPSPQRGVKSSARDQATAGLGWLPDKDHQACGTGCCHTWWARSGPTYSNTCSTPRPAGSNMCSTLSSSLEPSVVGVRYIQVLS